MGIFDRFPYSSTHEMNLDFMLGKATEIAESLQKIDTHKEQAEQAATNAAQSATSAAQSATSAAEQYQSARGAAIRAEVAQGNAENAATNAGDAADRAEAASDRADEAVEQAQTAAQNASTAATNASTAADGAIASAAAAETRINNLAASLPEDFTELNNEVTDLKSAINPLDIKFTQGYFYNQYSTKTANANYAYTDIIDIRPFKSITFTVYLTSSASCILFNKDKIKFALIKGTGSAITAVTQTVYSSDYSFVALSSYNDGDTYKPSVFFGEIVEDAPALNSLFEHEPSTNYIETFYANKAMNGGNTGTRKGFAEDVNGFYITSPVKLAEGVSYYRNGIFQKYYAFFDADMNFVSGAGNQSGDTALTNPFTIPTGAVYGVFTCINETNKNIAWIHTSNQRPPEFKYVDIFSTSSELNPINYTGREVSTLFYGIACGDSLTEGTFNTPNDYVNHQQYAYPYLFTKQTGVLLRNFGVGGTTAQTWYERYQNTTFPVYDFAIIAFGVNDLLTNVDPATTVTYLGNIVTKLKSNNADVKCFIATVNKAYSESVSSSDYNAMNTAIRNFANSTSGCYLLDIAEYGLTEPGTSYVNGHLTAIGYNELAREYANMISWNIYNHLSDFDELQFSGTDKTVLPSDLRDTLRILQ